jgi:hypothetical protein
MRFARESGSVRIFRAGPFASPPADGMVVDRNRFGEDNLYIQFRRHAFLVFDLPHQALQFIFVLLALGFPLVLLRGVAGLVWYVGNAGRSVIRRAARERSSRRHMARGGIRHGCPVRHRHGDRCAVLWHGRLKVRSNDEREKWLSPMSENVGLSFMDRCMIDWVVEESEVWNF